LATLLLGAIAPLNDSNFIYSPGGGWGGEAKILLAAASVATEGKSPEAVLAEFQRSGFFLTHVLECPSEGGKDDDPHLIANRLPVVLTRIRRSLKPKRLVPLAQALEQFLAVLKSGELTCAILLDRDKPFAVEADTTSESAKRLREALASPAASARQSFA